jgi:hypothetical protein
VGDIQSLIKLGESQPANTALLITSLAALATALCQVVFNVIRRKTKSLIEGNPVVLLVAGAMAALALFFESYLPLLFGLVPIVLCALFVAKGKRTRSIGVVYPRFAFRGWLAKPPVQNAAALIGIPVFLLTLAVTLLWERIEWRIELGRLATISVTFVLPSEDDPLHPDRAKRSSEKQYSELIFDQLRKDMVVVFSPLDDKIVILPTARYEYHNLASTFPTKLAITELPEVIKQFRDERHHVPVKFAIENTVSVADADFDAVDVTSRIVYFDWEKERSEYRYGPFKFEGRRSDLRRLSLLTTYEVVNFFLQGRGGVDLINKEKEDLRASLYTAFKDLHESAPPKQERFDQAGELQRIFTCTQGCAVDENLQSLVEIYNKPLKDDTGPARMKNEISILDARFKN